jgi:hypothetical protein
MIRMQPTTRRIPRGPQRGVARPTPRDAHVAATRPL